MRTALPSRQQAPDQRCQQSEDVRTDELARQLKTGLTFRCSNRNHLGALS
jgi:hypothetical protein